MRTPREPHKSRISSSKFKRAIAWWRAWTSSTRFRLCTNLPLEDEALFPKLRNSFCAEAIKDGSAEPTSVTFSRISRCLGHPCVDCGSTWYVNCACGKSLEVSLRDSAQRDWRRTSTAGEAS